MINIKSILVHNFAQPCLRHILWRALPIRLAPEPFCDGGRLHVCFVITGAPASSSVPSRR
jgi:hypothetical protein